MIFLAIKYHKVLRRNFIQFSLNTFICQLKSLNKALLFKEINISVKMAPSFKPSIPLNKYYSNHYFLPAWWHSHWFALGFEILPLPRIPCGAASVLYFTSRRTAWNELHKFCCKSLPQKWNQFDRSASLSHPHSR